MSESHYIFKNLPDDEKFTFNAGSYFSLSELNKKIMRMPSNMTKDQLLEVIRTDLYEVKVKLNMMMLLQKNGE